MTSLNVMRPHVTDTTYLALFTFMCMCLYMTCDPHVLILMIISMRIYYLGVVGAMYLAGKKVVDHDYSVGDFVFFTTNYITIISTIRIFGNIL